MYPYYRNQKSTLPSSIHLNIDCGVCDLHMGIKYTTRVQLGRIQETRYTFMI